MNVQQLRTYIIKPVLEELDPCIPYSESAVRLLLGTAAVESDCGKYLKQIQGPASSIYQIEPATHNDTYKNFLNYRPLLKERVLTLKIPNATIDSIIGNLYYSTAIARIKYYRSPRKLPDVDDLEGMAEMWRYDYNSIDGAHDNEAAIRKFMQKYNHYILPYVD